MKLFDICHFSVFTLHIDHINVRVRLSKKILTLGLKDEVPPHPKAVQLQKMVRYSATLFVQVTLRHEQSV